MNLIRLQEQFISELLDCVDDAWEKIEVHYERYFWDNQFSEIYIANRFLNNEKFDIDLSLESFDTLEDLQQIMIENQTENWTWLVFSLNSQGQYHFEYKYGIPPLIALEMAANK